MANTLTASSIDTLTKRLREPSWLTALRQQALARHTELPWPHPSDDIWRRTDVSLLDPARGEFSPAEAGLLEHVALTDSRFAALTQPLGDERLLTRVNGAWLTQAGASAGSAIRVEELAQALTHSAETLRPILESDGLTAAEQKLTSLNGAFHHDDLVVQVPPGHTAEVPFRLVHCASVGAKQALFPLTIIRLGAGSRLTLIDEYVSLPEAGGETPHLINGRIEIILEEGAALHYVRLQRWGSQACEFLLQQATLAKGASLTAANINLGAALSKAHMVTRLSGERASAKLYGFVFGHDRQHIDQHTLQDHLAPHTESDLEFRAALQDESRLVYTGLIRIAKAAVQTNAFQANHNLMLSPTARAETIPMLEILADDVQCKHGASVGPIDDEQAFYLMSRGIPREAAQRLIVMGYVESIIQRVPFAPLQEQLRREIEGGLRA